MKKKTYPKYLWILPEGMHPLALNELRDAIKECKSKKHENLYVQYPIKVFKFEDGSWIDLQPKEEKYSIWEKIRGWFRW